MIPLLINFTDTPMSRFSYPLYLYITREYLFLSSGVMGLNLFEVQNLNECRTFISQLLLQLQVSICITVHFVRSTLK